MAPGRLNVIGEHTDYNGGLAMPGAIDRWICVAAGFRIDGRILARSQDFGSELEFTPGARPPESWQRFVAGALAVFSERCAMSRGLNLLITGNIPPGSGLSSSGALGVALMNALREGLGVELDDLALVRLCQRVEHEHIGLSSGLLDQLASQFSRRGQVMVVDFSSLERRYLEADFPGWSWVVVDSGLSRELASTDYLARVRECQQGLDALVESGLPVAGFRDITPEIIERFGDRTWARRLRHFVTENRRVELAADCLIKQDIAGVGKLLVESPVSLRDDYEVSCPEMDFLVELAMEHPSCAGARMMGGGFGGCTVNLVRADGIGDFTRRLARSYQQRFNLEPGVHRLHLVNGARVMTG